MKRFLRYLLLVLCLGMIGAWGWSFYRVISVDYASPDLRYCAIIYSGYMNVLYDTKYFNRNDIASQGWHYSNDPVNSFIQKITSQQIRNRPTIQEMYSIPFWPVFIVLLLTTIMLWYHPLKDWWRGTDRQGFEVEMKDKVSADGE